ncbi:winged helix-turn-helix transcriptional regulator [Nocardia sp. NPDC050712]|uniref:winged helix-turn-helix transcriptional regulator n=1 Tax=Nocardia sp. NPDC050712 TaxID=3155518 RepID=UPI0033CF2659
MSLSEVRAAAPDAQVGAGMDPVAATFDLLGDRLTLAILRDAFLHEARRFNQWIERTGAPPAMLTSRLNALVEAGVLHRVPQPTAADRHEYLLTELGFATWEILICLWGWHREWSPSGALQPELVHTECGHRGPAVVLCRGCDRTVTPHETAVELRPDAVWALGSSGRRRSTRAPEAALSGRDMFTEVMVAIGDRWSAAVTGLALAGIRRFSDFRANLDISPTTLTDRLNRLCSAQILRKADGGREYRLTPRGRALFGVYAFLLSWSALAYPGARPGVMIRHSSCGQALVPALRCRGCDARVDRAAVVFEPLPDLAQPRLG